MIKANALVKKFGNFTALNDLNLEVKPGEVHGLLGPNGAGKSTTIRIILGLLQKTGGQVEVLGGDPWVNAVELHKRLTYVPGDVNLWENLSGGEIIDLLSSLRGKQDINRRTRLLEKFQLDPGKKFRAYSKGNRQKVALISALITDVELYIFDEPTSGLDPLLALEFQSEVKELKKSGKTILLSSHMLAEVEALCDQVTIIREGRVVETGSLQQLRHLTRTLIKVSLKQKSDLLHTLPGVHGLTIEGNSAEFEVEPEHLNSTLARLSEFGVESIVSRPPTLEELFIKYYAE